MLCVVLWIWFLFGPEIGDALDNECRIIAACESALGVGPILLGLAPVSLRNSSSHFVAQVTSGVGRIILKQEVARVVNLTRFLVGFDDEFLSVLSVGRNWAGAKHELSLWLPDRRQTDWPSLATWIQLLVGLCLRLSRRLDVCRGTCRERSSARESRMNCEWRPARPARQYRGPDKDGEFR